MSTDAYSFLDACFFQLSIGSCNGKIDAESRREKNQASVLHHTAAALSSRSYGISSLLISFSTGTISRSHV